MTTPLQSHAPVGTPVRIEVRRNLWLAGKTISIPYRLHFVSVEFHRVEVEIAGREHDYPITRVQRRRAR